MWHSTVKKLLAIAVGGRKSATSCTVLQNANENERPRQTDEHRKQPESSRQLNQTAPQKGRQKTVENESN